MFFKRAEQPIDIGDLYAQCYSSRTMPAILFFDERIPMPAVLISPAGFVDAMWRYTLEYPESRYVL